MSLVNRPSGAALRARGGGPVHWMTEQLEIPCPDKRGLSSSVPGEVTCPRCAVLVLAHGLIPAPLEVF